MTEEISNLPWKSTPISPLTFIYPEPTQDETFYSSLVTAFIQKGRVCAKYTGLFYD